MRQEVVLASKDIEVVTFTALENQYFVCFNIKLLLELLFHAPKSTIIHDLDVELSEHTVWVVRIFGPEVRLIIVNLLICLAEEVVESVTCHCLVLPKCLGDLVTYSMRILLVGLSWAASREEEASRLCLRPIILTLKNEVLFRGVKLPGLVSNLWL